MRLIKYAILALIAVVLATVALANAQMVTLRLIPEALSGYLGFAPTVTLPMFLVILISVAVGLLIGYLFEYIREHKHRSTARAERRERQKLETEIRSGKAGKPANKGDEILALLEDGSVPARKAS
ncbi:LapA family protein [Palleronia caenipelagi]|uniref:LapA family protein n=1 Tax=Palleronia caenipelagi TaxID=2489174 RepID=A0A547Q2U8_9RHOB|nr:LapA family protein [Palleronia caenipelagi]TRD20691.1 LapA family protein [Palleronia caenipelagi]